MSLAWSLILSLSPAFLLSSSFLILSYEYLICQRGEICSLLMPGQGSRGSAVGWSLEHELTSLARSCAEGVAGNFQFPPCKSCQIFSAALLQRTINLHVVTEIPVVQSLTSWISSFAPPSPLGCLLLRLLADSPTPQRVHGRQKAHFLCPHIVQ